MRAFARSRGGFTQVDDVAWSIFFDTTGLSVVERRETGSFALINGTETEQRSRLPAALRGGGPYVFRQALGADLGW